MTSTQESKVVGLLGGGVCVDFLLRAEHKHEDRYQKVSRLYLGRYKSDLDSFPGQTSISQASETANWLSPILKQCTKLNCSVLYILSPKVSYSMAKRTCFLCQYPCCAVQYMCRWSLGRWSWSLTVLLSPCFLLVDAVVSGLCSRTWKRIPTNKTASE